MSTIVAMACLHAEGGSDPHQNRIKIADWSFFASHRREHGRTHIHPDVHTPESANFQAAGPVAPADDRGKKKQ